jgi:hypothetical protein
MGLFRTISLGCLAVLFGGVPVTASPENGVPDYASYTPEIAPTRITRDEAPAIDGQLDDAVWQKAARITDFYKVEPDVGLPSEETIVYFAYDAQNLYIGMDARDTEADRIVKSVLDRDGEVWRDDMVRIYIDPFNTGLSGFGFDVNALGARLDRLLLPGRRPNNAWDTIWDAKTEITDTGWTAEIVIPFRSISFNPETDGWNLLLTREITHKGEEARWASVDPGIWQFDFRHPGKITGIHDIDQGLGLDVDLQGKITATRNWDTPRHDVVTLEPSANLYYKFSPALVGLLTINSDFSDTPLDTREINTGRFSLFRAETRDFFLQDAYIFEFAGETFTASPNGQPFFSRRIGIVNGQQADLKFGAKLSGELAGFDVGVLSARMGDVGNIDAQTLSVARITRNIGAQSRLGFIMTNGDPTGATDNTVAGVDYLYRDPSFLGGGYLQADLFYQRSMTSSEDDDSFGIRVDYPNDKWNWTIAARQIGEDFRPVLGFVNRPGTRDYSGQWRRRYRPADSFFKWYQFGSDNQLITDLDGEVETRKNTLAFEFQNQATDEFKFYAYENREVVKAPFLLPDNIIVPAGEYQNNGVKFALTSSWLRTWGVEADIEYKDFFGGDNFNFMVTSTMHPSRYLTLKASYDREAISLPSGDVTIHIASLENIVSFSPDISVATEMQYDNISEAFSLFSRARWEVRPQTELFLSFGHGAIIQSETFPRDFESVQSQLVFRFGNRFQF